MKMHDIAFVCFNMILCLKSRNLFSYLLSLYSLLLCVSYLINFDLLFVVAGKYSHHVLV